MSRDASFYRFTKAIAQSLGVCLLIVVFFSPPWLSFVGWWRMPERFADLVPVRRGVAVERQVTNPFDEIHDPIHKIVRWRLFFPLVGHALDLPPLAVLLLSPLGCVIALALLIDQAQRRGVPWLECDLLAVVVGTASWFFVATGWLGYFDSWLVLGLLAVAFAPRRWTLLPACAFTPWIDERFVIAFPLAMLVRWLDDTRGESSLQELPRWLLRETLPSLLLLAAVLGVRLSLAGRSGSEDLSAYLQRVAFFHLPAARLILGGWEGLRVGWIVLVVGVAVLARRGGPLVSVALCAGILGTTVVGLASANDLSRSATLAVPAVPLCWIHARSIRQWRRWRVAWLLAAAALAIPARHVVSDFVMPVNPLSVELRMLADSGLMRSSSNR